VVGFVPHRSILDGASKHCGASWIFSTDIVNFFQTTSSHMVVKALQSYGYPTHGAELITDLSCLNGNLAQGSPASPVLSNIAFLQIDNLLSDYCNNLNLVYTRYADDIIVSGRRNIPNDLEERVKTITEVENWALSKDKTKLIRAPRRLKVYGLVVNGETPRLTKGYRKKIRAIKHLLNSRKIPEDRCAEAMGHLSFARSVEEFTLRHS